jgi:hypothetical protein
MNDTWTPETESEAVTLKMPEGWTEIDSRANLIALVAIRIRELILQSDEPEWEVRHFLTTLDEAGLIDPYLDEKALAKANRSEIYNLLDRPELESRIYDLADVSKKDFPLKPNSKAPDWYSEMTLLDWANAVVM